MRKYLCLIYFDEEDLSALSEAEYAAITDRCLDYEDELRESRQLMAAEALEPVQTATTVRVRNDRTSISDGPFMETKEQLGGFSMIEARDLNEALQVASNLPQARFGSIEVRPIRELRRTATGDRRR